MSGRHRQVEASIGRSDVEKVGRGKYEVVIYAGEGADYAGIIEYGGALTPAQAVFMTKVASSVCGRCYKAEQHSNEGRGRFPAAADRQYNWNGHGRCRRVGSEFGGRL